MDLRQISYFTWVYEERSIIAAARKANVVAAAISMQIKRLEQELSTQLFQRSAQGLTPTAAGDRFYGHCTDIMRSVALAKEETIGSSDLGRVIGRVRLGLTPVLSSSVLVSVVERFTELYPLTTLSILEAYSGTAVDAVLSGDVDFAFGVSPPKATGFVQRAIFTDDVVVVSGKQLFGKPSFDSIDLTEHDDLKLILPSIKHSFSRVLNDYITAQIIRPERIIEIDGQVAAINLLRTSDWLLVCPFVTICNAFYSDLYVYRVRTPVIPFTIYLVYDQRRPLNVASTRFVQIVEAELQQIAKLRHRLK